MMNTREKNGKWELPTRDELYSLYDENAPKRSVDCGGYVRMVTDMIHVICLWFWASGKSPSGSRFGAVSLNGWLPLLLPPPVVFHQLPVCAGAAEAIDNLII